MKARVNPTEKVERLKENLEKRVEAVKQEENSLVVETDSLETLRKTPGIENFVYKGEDEKGLQGKPVQEPAYAKLETREDAVKAFLATVQGYDLRILNTSREWDLRKLREYNPDIKHLKLDRPREELGIEKTISELEGVEKVSIELPGEDETELIYREMLT